MADHRRDDRGRSRNFGERGSGQQRETGYWSGRGGSDRYGEYRGQQEYSDDYPSYGSQYGRDRDFGYTGDRNQWSEHNRPYNEQTRFGAEFEAGENDRLGYRGQDRGRWPEQENPYARNTSVLGERYGGYRHQRDYAPGYGHRREEPRGFGGFDSGGWGDQQRRGEPHPYMPNEGRYGRERYNADDRGWWDRTTDEVSSWFGDDDAQRRRDMDENRSHRGRGPKGYKRSDERIREDLSDRFSDDNWLDASDIEIQVSQGEVTLTGTVDSRAAKYRAEMMAENCSGVSEVQNNLRVTKHTDSPSTFDASASAGKGSSASKNKTTTY